MAKALFISTKDIKRYSVMNGNVDNDKFIQFIEIAQEIHLQNYLGTTLYEKLEDIIIAGTVNDPVNVNYKTLLETYVKPMTIHWAQVEFLPYAAYTIANGGVYKHTSETSQSVDKEEIDYLVEQERNVAQHYTRRFIDYMSYNQTLYPEYYSNSNDDMYPDTDANFSGWVI